MEDVSKVAKSKQIWSGQDVLNLRLFEGLWTRRKIYLIMKALSSKFHNKLIWLTGIDGYVLFFVFIILKKKKID